jgi:hypothetical protein
VNSLCKTPVSSLRGRQLKKRVHAQRKLSPFSVLNVAAELLNPNAQAQIKSILGNDDLSYVSTWMDDARNLMKHHTGPLIADPEAYAFNKKFPNTSKQRTRFV